MFQSAIQKILVLVCSLFLFASCSHMGYRDKCGCTKDKMTCAHHQDGKNDKADEECKDCKK